MHCEWLRHSSIAFSKANVKSRVSVVGVRFGVAWVLLVRARLCVDHDCLRQCTAKATPMHSVKCKTTGGRSHKGNTHAYPPV